MKRNHTLNAAAAAVFGAMLLTSCATSTDGNDAAPTVRSEDPALGMTPGNSPTAMPGMPGMSAPAPPAHPPAGPNAIDIDNFAFAPSTMTVKAGTTVTWTNRDEEPHTVVAHDGSFHSPGMGTGATYSFTFDHAGTFAYICSIHPFMRATVVVTP